MEAQEIYEKISRLRAGYLVLTHYGRYGKHREDRFPLPTTTKEIIAKVDRVKADWRPESLKIAHWTENPEPRWRKAWDVPMDNTPTHNDMNTFQTQPPITVSQQMPETNTWQGLYIKSLMDKVSELSAERNKLAERVEQLKDENTRLREENRFKDREHQLAMRSSEMENTSGLGSLAEKVVSNDQAMDVIAGLASKFLFGNQQPQQAAPQAPQQPSSFSVASQPENPLKQEAKNHLDQFVSSSDDETIARAIYLIEQEKKAPGTLKNAIEGGQQPTPNTHDDEELFGDDYDDGEI